MLAVCVDATDYERFCVVLTGYAESDYRSDAVQRATVGVFQQNARYWPSAMDGAAAQCRAFLVDFRGAARHHNGDPVHDCWVTQRWVTPNGGVTWPDPGPGFVGAPETVNYSRRVPAVARIISERTLP